MESWYHDRAARVSSVQIIERAALMHERYLRLGVRGMAVAREPFMAHFGAAVLAAWWFDQDHNLSPGVSAAMTRQADLLMKKHEWLFIDPPPGSDGIAAPGELLDALRPQLGGVHAIGHDVIFTALALRVFELMPELCTRAVVGGLTRLIESCRDFPLTDVASVFDVSGVSADELGDVDISTARGIANMALVTAVGFEHVYVGLHQGNIGHIVDHAHALLTLEQLGHNDIVDTARGAFATHAAALQHVWAATADLEEAPDPPPENADTIAYWDRDLAWNDWANGHAFKYPYALFDLVRLVDDELASAAQARIRTRPGTHREPEHNAQTPTLQLRYTCSRAPFPRCRIDQPEQEGAPGKAKPRPWASHGQTMGNSHGCNSPERPERLTR